VVEVTPETVASRKPTPKKQSEVHILQMATVHVSYSLDFYHPP